MKFWKVVACLAALALLSSPALGAGNLEYSGVPGKWRRAPKASKKAAGEAEAKAKDTEPGAEQPTGKDGKKARTYTISIPEEALKPPKK